MKKVVFTLMLAVCSVFAVRGQGLTYNPYGFSDIYATTQPFFDNVSYKGAFGTGANADWTAGWSSFTPQTNVYAGDIGGESRQVINFSGDISGNVTWEGNKLYVVSGTVHVLSGAKLTIGAGCVVRGSLSNRFVLIVSRGGQIDAQGTSTNPIIFTSNAAPGNRVRGDWGGIILCGRASVNKWTAKPSAGGTYIGTSTYEALPNDPLCQFGGGVNFNDHDNSGIMKYCRLEYAGYVYIPNQEINGLTFAGIGDATSVNYIQVSYSLDDSFEWFGGTSNHKYLIAFAGTDDEFDTDQGYRGMWQFFLGVRNPAIYDVPGGTSNGYEHDNNTNYNGGASSGESTPGWQLPLPVTTVLASNVTLVGPIRNGETKNDLASTIFGRCLETRSSARSSHFNSIFTGYTEGQRWGNNSSVATDSSYSKNIVTYGNVKVRNNIFASATSPDVIGTGGSGNNATGSSTMVATTTSNNSIVSRDQFQFTNGSFTGDQLGALSQFNFSNCSWTLAASSNATSGASFSDAFFTGKVLSANQAIATISTTTSTICSGGSVAFTSSVSGGTATSYQWYTGAGAISGATSSTYTATNITSNTSYYVVVIANGVSSQSNTVPVTVSGAITQSVQVLSQSVPAGSAANLGTSANPFGACSGATLNFTALPTNGGSTPGYRWTLNNGTTTRVVDNDINYLATGLANGSYTLTVKMRSSLACASPTVNDSTTATYYFSIGVTRPSVYLRSSLTNQNLGGRTNLANIVLRDYPSDKKNRIERYAGNQVVLVNFTALVTNASVSNFQWKRNGVNVGSNSSTYAANDFNGDDISCVITDACGNTATSNVVTVVKVLPPATATVLGTSTLQVNAGATVTINATATPTTTQYSRTAPRSNFFFDSAAYLSSPSTYTTIWNAQGAAVTYAGTIGTINYVLNGPNSTNVTNTTGTFTITNMDASKTGNYTISTFHSYVTNSPMSSTTDIVNSTNTNQTNNCTQGTLATVFVSLNGDLNVAQNTTRTINSGDVTTYGAIYVDSLATLTLNTNVSASAIYVNGGGTLVTKGNTVTLTSSLSTDKTATLSIGHASGINGAFVGGSRVLSPLTNYIFNGTSAQVTGSVLATAKNITINNTSGVTLSAGTAMTGTLSLVAGNFAVGNGLLTLVSNAAGTAIVDDFSGSNAGTMSGNFNFQRYSASTSLLGNNRHFAAPLNGVLRSQLGACANQNDYSELNNTWTKSASNCANTNLASGSSVLAYGVGNLTFQFTGSNSTGAKSFALTRTNLPSTASIQRGFNAIGNPYPSAIDWLSVVAIDGNNTNSNLTAWIFKNGQYATITSLGATTNGASRFIAPGQGFLLRRSTVSGPAFLLMDNSVRVASTSTAFLREAVSPSQSVRFTVSSPATEISDEILVMGSSQASEGEDAMDAAKLISPETTAPSFYTTATDEIHAVEAVPTITEKGRILPVTVSATVAGTYTIHNTEVNNLPAGMKVMIEDRATGKVKEMTEGFSFPMAAGTTKSFNLHFTMGNGTSEMSKLVDIFSANGAINVAFATSEVANAEVLVLDATGKTIASTSANGNTLVTIPVNASNGIYIVKVAGSTGTTSAKVYFTR